MGILKTVKLTSFGFERWPEEDFSDDGNRFTCYKYYGCRVSYLHSNNRWYIAARYEGQELSWEEKQDLPYKNYLDMLNGVDSVSSEEIEELKEAIVNYMNAYMAKAEEMKKHNPTKEEIRKKVLEIRNDYTSYIEDINSKIDYKILKLSEYVFKSIKNYYDSLIRLRDSFNEDMVDRLFGTAESRNFVAKERARKYYYHYILDYLNRGE